MRYEQEDGTSICAGTVDWWLGMEEGKKLGNDDGIRDIWLEEKADWVRGGNIDGTTRLQRDTPGFEERMAQRAKDLKKALAGKNWQKAVL